MYGNRQPPEDPPCDTCRVEPYPDNAEALKVYLMTRNQYIMGFNGPVAINHLAVWEFIDRFGVKDPVAVFERVVMCAGKVISTMMKRGN